MGIREVQRQLDVEQGRLPTGGGPYQEQQRSPRTSGQVAGGVLPQQRTVIGTDEKLLWMMYVVAGLLAVNALLLAQLLARL